MDSLDASLNDEELALGISGWGGGWDFGWECQEVDEDSEPEVERPGTLEGSLKEHVDEHPAGTEKGEMRLQLQSSEAPARYVR